MSTQMAILIDGQESFSGRCIKGLRGIHMQSFDEIPLLIMEEIQ